MRADARLLAVTVPIGFPGQLRRAQRVRIKLRAWRIAQKVAVMNERFGVSESRQKSAGSETISPEGVTVLFDKRANRKPVGLGEGFKELVTRHIQTHVADIIVRRRASFRSLVDVERPLHLAMRS